MAKITSAEAQRLFDAFSNTKSKELDKIVKKISNGKLKKDGVSTWFSLKDLKDYIKYLEDEGNNVNGVRVFLGAYSPEQSPKNKDEYSTTVFMVPTQLKSTTKVDVTDEEKDSIDIPSLDAFNGGTIGQPPKGPYDPPQ